MLVRIGLSQTTSVLTHLALPAAQCGTPPGIVLGTYIVVSRIRSPLTNVATRGCRFRHRNPFRKHALPRRRNSTERQGGVCSGTNPSHVASGDWRGLIENISGIAGLRRLGCVITNLSQPGCFLHRILNAASLHPESSCGEHRKMCCRGTSVHGYLGLRIRPTHAAGC